MLNSCPKLVWTAGEEYVPVGRGLGPQPLHPGGRRGRAQLTLVGHFGRHFKSMILNRFLK